MKVEPWIRGKTFNDITFSDEYGKAKSRGEITDLRSQFSQNISLNLPIVSSNMDTITEAFMGIAVAREGGIGIIHRELETIERQAKEVRKVKRAENYIIEKPYSLGEENSIGEAKALMKQEEVGTLVVIDEENRLRGILTKTDIHLLDDNAKTNRMLIKERMGTIENGRLHFHKGMPSSLQGAKKILDKSRIEKLVLVEKDSLTVKGLITATDIEKLIKHPLANKDSKGHLRVGAAIGAKGDFLERAVALIEAGVDVLVMDIAHGYSVNMKKGVEQFREKIGDFELVCGNIATKKGAEFLRDLGVQGIKIGLGPGRGCRTRIETGFGVPQIQAIRDVYCAVGDKIPKIADGGIEKNGEIWKAIAFGADCVMLGNMLGATDEAPGIMMKDPAKGGQWVKSFGGMTSPQAKLRTDSDEEPSHIEGQQKDIPYRGSVHSILRGMRESLQSSISYIGEITLRDARKKVVNNIGDFAIVQSVAAQGESYGR